MSMDQPTMTINADGDAVYQYSDGTRMVPLRPDTHGLEPDPDRFGECPEPGEYDE